MLRGLVPGVPLLGALWRPLRRWWRVTTVGIMVTLAASALLLALVGGATDAGVTAGLPLWPDFPPGLPPWPCVTASIPPQPCW